MAELFANRGDADQTPHSAASDLGLHCLSITLSRVFRLQWVNLTVTIGTYHIQLKAHIPKCTAKKFCSLQITASVLFVYFFMKAVTSYFVYSHFFYYIYSHFLYFLSPLRLLFSFPLPLLLLFPFLLLFLFPFPLLSGWPHIFSNQIPWFFPDLIFPD